MPHFNENGEGTWICQACARIYPDSVESEWIPQLTGSEQAANVCPRCVDKWEMVMEAAGIKTPPWVRMQRNRRERRANNGRR